MPSHEAGFKFDDSAANLNWKLPEADLILSEKDKKQPNFMEAIKFDFAEEFYATLLS